VLDHVTIIVRDLEASKRFYEETLRPIGYGLAVEGEGFAALGAGDHVIPDLWLRAGEPTTPSHVAFRGDRAGVDRFHEAGLQAGGEDNGPPGVRSHYHETYYAAYIHDPDGHNVEVVCHT
jgi:catechol 2,3-dioxygenase-like lactoylglutathione lyase family enzyme